MMTILTTTITLTFLEAPRLSIYDVRTCWQWRFRFLYFNLFLFLLLHFFLGRSWRFLIDRRFFLILFLFRFRFWFWFRFEERRHDEALLDGVPEHPVGFSSGGQRRPGLHVGHVAGPTARCCIGLERLRRYGQNGCSTYQGIICCLSPPDLTTSSDNTNNNIITIASFSSPK